MSAKHTNRRARIASAPLLAAGLVLFAAGSAAVLDGPSQPRLQLEPPLAVTGAGEPAHENSVDPTRRSVSNPQAGFYTAAPGTRLRFALAAESRPMPRGKRPDNVAAPIRWTAHWIVDILRQDATQVVVAVQTDDARLESPTLAIASTEHAAVELPRTIVVLSADGTVTGYRFAPGLDAEQRNRVRNVVGALAFGIKPGPPTSWQLRGHDGAGTFVARDVRESEGRDALCVARQKLGYVATADGAGMPEHEITGVARATFDRRIGWLREVHIDETFRLTSRDLRDAIAERTILSLTLTDVTHPGTCETDSALLAVDIAAADGSEEEFVLSDEERRRLIEKGLRGVTFEQALRELLASLSGETGGDALTQRLGTIADLVWLRPELSLEIEQLVQRPTTDAELSRLLVTALGVAGHEAAQGALVRLFESDALPVDLRESALVSMSQVERAGRDMVESIVGRLNGSPRYDSLETTAMLVLGAIEDRSADASPRDAIETLLGLEGRARSEGQLSTVHALGNTRSPAVVNRITPYVTDTSEELRFSAVSALKRVDAPAARELLAERARCDESATVRARAVRSLAAHENAAEVGALFAEIALGDAKIAVRRQAIYALAKEPRRQLSVLQHIARSDASEELRGLAQSLTDAAARGTGD